MKRNPNITRVQIPIKLRDDRSYANVLSTMSADTIPLEHSLDKVPLVANLPAVNLVILGSKEYDILWLRNSLVGWTYDGVDYSLIQSGLRQDDLLFLDFVFLGLHKF
ncbi:hypothetical protein H0E87_021287 [Populus deltoides]|uniref:Uncharacterized protein n=1 Tax=Populus deltoides TaxID=3696 RepID=A0A8T2XPR8_POPDE|nr:hypothetical protein H0E87_021287 [Populus deltoides]